MLYILYTVSCNSGFSFTSFLPSDIATDLGIAVPPGIAEAHTTAEYCIAAWNESGLS